MLDPVEDRLAAIRQQIAAERALLNAAEADPALKPEVLGKFRYLRKLYDAVDAAIASGSFDRVAAALTRKDEATAECFEVLSSRDLVPIATDI